MRRYLAPGLLCGAMFYFTLDWRYVVGLPLMFGSLSLGYGSDVEFTKIIKRGIFGLANGITSSMGNLLNKRFVLAIFHSVLVIACSVYFGVYNPFENAMIEQGVIGFIISFIPVMSARRREA